METYRELFDTSAGWAPVTIPSPGQMARHRRYFMVEGYTGRADLLPLTARTNGPHGLGTAHGQFIGAVGLADGRARSIGNGKFVLEVEYGYPNGGGGSGFSDAPVNGSRVPYTVLRQATGTLPVLKATDGTPLGFEATVPDNRSELIVVSYHTSPAVLAAWIAIENTINTNAVELPAFEGLRESGVNAFAAGQLIAKTIAHRVVEDGVIAVEMAFDAGPVGFAQVTGQRPDATGALVPLGPFDVVTGAAWNTSALWDLSYWSP